MHASPGCQPGRFVETLDAVADDADLAFVFKETAQVLHSYWLAAEVATGSAACHVVVDPEFLEGVGKASAVDGVEGDLAYASLLKHR